MTKRTVRITERLAFIFEMDGPDDPNEFDDMVQELDSSGKLTDMVVSAEPVDIGRTWSIDRTEDPTSKPAKKTRSKTKKVSAGAVCAAHMMPWPCSEQSEDCTPTDKPTCTRCQAQPATHKFDEYADAAFCKPCFDITGEELGAVVPGLAEPVPIHFDDGVDALVTAMPDGSLKVEDI